MIEALTALQDVFTDPMTLVWVIVGTALGITVGAGGFLQDLFRMRTGRGLAPGHGFSRLAERVLIYPDDGGDTVDIMFDGDVLRVPAPFALTLGPSVDFVVGTEPRTT